MLQPRLCSVVLLSFVLAAPGEESPVTHKTWRPFQKTEGLHESGLCARARTAPSAAGSLLLLKSFGDNWRHAHEAYRPRECVSAHDSLDAVAVHQRKRVKA